MPLQERLAQLLTQVDGDAISLGELLCDRHDPDAVAFTVVSPEQERTDLTFGELRARSEAFAAALLNLGITPGDRVATLLGKSLDLPVVMLGIWRAGAILVPLFTQFAPTAIAARLAAATPAIVVCDADQRAKLDPGQDTTGGRGRRPSGPRIIQVGGQVPPGKHRLDRLIRWAQQHGWEVPQATGDPMQEFVRLFTSGTTGDPKGVPIPYRAVAGFQAHLEFALDIREDDVYWNTADPAWAYGLYYAVIAPMAAGRRSILLTSPFNTTLSWSLISSLNVTHLTGAPTSLRALKQYGGPIPRGLRLRRLTTAGEPLTPGLYAWAQRELDILIHDHFGQTELGMCAANAWHPELARPLKAGSMGRALPGWSLQVLSADGEPLPTGRVGRVAVDRQHSPAMWFSGYVQAPEEDAERFTPDGRWYYTGDTGYIDHEGYLFFGGRDDDVIITGGYRIGAFEVEQVLAADPRVAEAAVVGVPDAIRGQAIEAFVVPAAGVPLDAELSTSLQALVGERIAEHAYPRAVHLVAQLPKSRTRLVRRHILRDLPAARAKAATATSRGLHR